jgi:hypothetical protein
MKQIILTVQAIALLAAGELSGQVLKWSQLHANATVYARAGDGKGGVAFVLRSGSTDEAATVTWIAPAGKVLLNVEIERNHEDARVDIVRMLILNLVTGDRECGRPFVMNDCSIHKAGELPRSPAPFHAIYALHQTRPSLSACQSAA